jgi:hypothetical protein
MRLIPLILVSFMLASGARAAEGNPAASSPSAVPQSAPVAQNPWPEAEFYNNHSLNGTYRLHYIPGLSTSGARGSGQIVYDGNGRFSGYDDCTTFEGTYSVNPDGTGTSASKIRRVGCSWPAGLWSCRATIGSFKIHPSGALEFQNICSPAYPGMIDRAFQAVTFGTQHKDAP